MLRRKIQKTIQDYYRFGSNKILLLDGARQIGKSFIIRYEGKRFYKNYIEINFLEDKNGEKLFSGITTTKDFYLKLSVYAGEIMGTKEDTLVFLDEIQAYPELLTLIKFLKDEDRFTYIASGSLLGVTLNKTLSKPGGRIQKIKMYPLDFEEFLWANGIGEEVISHLNEQFKNEESINESLHSKFLDLFKKYMLIGGLPDAVNTFIETSNIVSVLAVSNPKFPLKESEQKTLIKLYLNDVGLLTNLLYRYNINAVIKSDNSINLGAVYETVIAQELSAHGYILRYYDNKTKGEVDFLVDDYDSLSAMPIYYIMFLKPSNPDTFLIPASE